MGFGKKLAENCNMVCDMKYITIWDKIKFLYKHGVSVKTCDFTSTICFNYGSETIAEIHYSGLFVHDHLNDGVCDKILEVYKELDEIIVHKKYKERLKEQKRYDKINSKFK